MGEHRGGGWKKAKEEDGGWRMEAGDEGGWKRTREKVGGCARGESRKTSGRMKEDDWGWRWIGTPSKCVYLTFLVNANAASSSDSLTKPEWLLEENGDA
jgi:hypothetical protein